MISLEKLLEEGMCAIAVNTNTTSKMQNISPKMEKVLESRVEDQGRQCINSFCPADLDKILFGSYKSNQGKATEA